MYPKDDMKEFQKAKYSLMLVQKGLTTMNLICVIASGLMWVVSLVASVSDALKHGIKWEVIQIVDGVQTVTTRNTILNVGMSGVFLFLMLTTALSYSAFVVMRNAFNDGGLAQ